jgi:hypothetical protein
MMPTLNPNWDTTSCTLECVYVHEFYWLNSEFGLCLDAGFGPTRSIVLVLS